MNFLVACDNVGLEGSYVLCLFTEENEAYWVTSLNPFKPIAAKGICEIEEGYVVVIETKFRNFYLVILDKDLSILRTTFLPNIDRVTAVFSNNNKIYVICENSVLVFNSSLRVEAEHVYSSLESFSLTGGCVIGDKLVLSATNFNGQGKLIEHSGAVFLSDCREPWSPIPSGETIIFVDSIQGEVRCNLGTAPNFRIEQGYPRVVVAHNSVLYVFFNLWRRYKRSNIFRGHWDRVPAWLENPTDSDAYSSGIFIFDQNEGTLLRTIPTTDHWYEVAGALPVEARPPSSWLCRDDARLAAMRIRRNLNELGQLRKVR